MHIFETVRRLSHARLRFGFGPTPTFDKASRTTNLISLLLYAAPNSSGSALHENSSLDLILKTIKINIFDNIVCDWSDA